MNYKEFFEQYKPEINEFNPEGAFSGHLFTHDKGKQGMKIKTTYNIYIWSLLKDISGLYLLPGKHALAVGYFICKEASDLDSSLIVNI